MRSCHQKVRGFSLIELLVVVAIVVSLSAAAYFSLGSRVSATRVESAARMTAEILETARSQALLKRCPTRIIFCTDRDCADRVTDPSQASFIAVLRRAQYTNPNQSCFIPGGSVTVADADGYRDWDFEMRPQAISQNIQFSNIYIPGAVNHQNYNWTNPAAAPVLQSIWFPRSLSVVVGLNDEAVPANIPVGGDPEDRRNAAENMAIFFQVHETGCNPSTEDCVAFFVGLSQEGKGVIQRCIPGESRVGGNSDGCF